MIFSSVRPEPTTHAGYFILQTLGCSASWKSKRVSAASIVSSRCLSLRFELTSAAPSRRDAKNRVRKGVLPVAAAATFSCEVEGEAGPGEGAGRNL